MCILGPYQMLLKMGLIDLDLQGHFGLKPADQFFANLRLGRTITHQGCKLESPYLLIMCILGPCIAKTRAIDLDLHGHLRQMFTLLYLD